MRRRHARRSRVAHGAPPPRAPRTGAPVRTGASAIPYMADRAESATAGAQLGNDDDDDGTRGAAASLPPEPAPASGVHVSPEPVALRANVVSPPPPELSHFEQMIYVVPDSAGPGPGGGAL